MGEKKRMRNDAVNEEQATKNVPHRSASIRKAETMKKLA
jgi:hypothetical protein